MSQHQEISHFDDKKHKLKLTSNEFNYLNEINFCILILSNQEEKTQKKTQKTGKVERFLLSWIT